MGVLPCSRTDCENVMCDRLFDGRHYVCSECFEEMKRKVHHPSDKNAILEFLESQKSYFRKVNLDDLWDEVVPESWS